MTFTTELSPIGRIGTGLLPPKTARIELPTTTARDQSIFSWRATQSGVTKWINCRSPLLPVAQARPAAHAGATPQFLRQHFPRDAASQYEHDAHKACRSAKRGLPPLGFAFGLGMNGCMSSHNLVGRSAAAIEQFNRRRPRPRRSPAAVAAGDRSRNQYTLHST
jgi:hypothetical protein